MTRKKKCNSESTKQFRSSDPLTHRRLRGTMDGACTQSDSPGGRTDCVVCCAVVSTTGWWT